MREVGVAVHLEPLLPRAGGEIAFEIAARMQPLSSPVRRRQQRHVDLLEVRGARAVVIIDEPAPQRLAADIGAVIGELLLGQRRGPGDRLAGDEAPRSALADAMLDAGDLAARPARQKIAQDAAVAAQLAVIVGRAFPDAQRGQVRRLERRHLPLVHRIVGDAVDADLATAPGPGAGPLDAVVEVLGFARGPHVEVPGERPAPRESTRTTA